MSRAYTVYKGEIKGRLVYIGTTIQKPSNRFRWHKNNGKPFDFTVLSQHETSEEMLEEELRLIKKHKPKYNKIRHRKQNLNVKLSKEDLDKRVGDSEWCQSCLKRRVNNGYSKCYYC